LARRLLTWLLVLSVSVVGRLNQQCGAQQQPVVAVAASSVSGVVIDFDGAGISGAQVVLHLDGSNTDATTVTDANGRFVFSAARAGSFAVRVVATGFGPGKTTGTLREGNDVELDPIKLAAAASIDVEVGAMTQQEIAEEQIHAEETQRLIGVVPNFFVTYTWKAAPLTPRQKFELSWKSALDPFSIGVVVATAGVQQAENHFAAYGPGVAGYSKRFGADYADLAIGTFVGGYVFPSLLRQDPRYFYKGTGSFMSRALYALSTAVICRGDNGHWQPNYSGVLGDLAAGAASNLYYPAYDRTGASLTIENGLVSAALDGVGNLLQEFVYHHFTPALHKQQPPSTPAAPSSVPAAPPIP
jgi:hypothetical protein